MATRLGSGYEVGQRIQASYTRLVSIYEIRIRDKSFGERDPYPMMMAAKTNVTRALKLKNRVCMCVCVS